MSDDIQRKIQDAIEWGLAIDKESARSDVSRLRSKHDGWSREEIAQKIISGTSWKNAAAGAASGLPSNPFAAAGTGLADGAYTLRSQMEMAGRVALLYDSNFLEDEDSMWELFVPLFGAVKAGRALKKAGVQAGKNLTRRTIRRYLSKGTLKAFQKATVKIFGKKVLQQTVITKTVPVVGAVISGSWNFVESRVVGGRVIRYFNGEGLSAH